MKTLAIARTSLAGGALALALLGSSARASAAGVGLDPRELPASTQSALRADIERARAEAPELFKAVASVAARAEELDASARRPGVPLTLHLKPLGHRALFPMLELLVFDARAPRDLSASAATALRLGLIEAIGSIRDARAVPVLAKVLERGRDARTERAAAEALARIGTDEALDLLIAAANGARAAGLSERDRAVLAGMHDARRERAARYLAARLQQEPDPDTARVLARSLGGVGSAWAWQTLSDAREASATRALAATALLDAYVRLGGAVREQAAKALLVVDEPSTPARIAQARRGASGDLAAALDALDRRFAASPLR